MTTPSPAQADRAGKPRLMTIFAHPDDETFSLAGTMARATAAGHPVAVVSATRGEAGEIADPTLATKETLGRVREGELRRAMAAVGVEDVSFLDYIDGRLPEADPDEAVGRIVAHIRRFRPDVVVTFAANGGYGHVDHMAIHRLTLVALRAAADESYLPDRARAASPAHRVRKLYYAGFPRERMLTMVEAAKAEGRDFIPGGDAATIPLAEMGTPEAEITTRVALSDAEFAAKLRAILAHATQLPPGNPWTSSTPEQARTFAGTETFQLAPPPLSDRAYPTPEGDLFAGL